MADYVPEIVSGDDTFIPLDLTKNDLPFSIDPGATVTAAVVSFDGNIIYLPEVAVVESTTGSDWPNSRVVVAYPSSATALLTYFGMAKIEIQVYDSIKATFFNQVLLVKGAIA